MSSPLERLLGSAAVTVTSETIDGFLGSPGPALLIFTGDPAQRAEAQDVAVVAGEIARGVPGTLRIGVATSVAPDPLNLRFGITAVPTVIFLVNGVVKATLARLQDWAVYARTAATAFGEHQEGTP
jgi:hydrogenase-1 operon protein HyaE